MNPLPTPSLAPSRIRRRNYGKNHAYYLQLPDGGEQKLDGVTTLLSDGIPKPALMNWAGNVTAEYAVDNWSELGLMTPTQRLKELKAARFKDRDTAAQRGTDIHVIAEDIIGGTEVDVPDELAGHVNSAVQFLDRLKVRPLLTETTVFSVKHLYAGTLDMVVTSDWWDEICGEKRVILADWKTSRSGLYGETALQLSAYGNADFYQDPDGHDKAVADLGITDHWGIWVRADGFDVYPMDRSPETFLFFRYALTLARRIDKGPGLLSLRGEALNLPAVS